jgi:hypothetical protein
VWIAKIITLSWSYLIKSCARRGNMSNIFRSPIYSKLIIVQPHVEIAIKRSYVWYLYTGCFINPSGISEVCSSGSKSHMGNESMSVKRVHIQVLNLLHKCSICPPLVTRQTSILVLVVTSKQFYIPTYLNTALKSDLFYKLEEVSSATKQGVFSWIFRETGGSTVGFH